MEEYLFAWILCGLGAAIIASNRGEKVGQWVFIGVFLGPIGVVLALLGGRRCPHCQSKVHLRAEVCPKCHEKLPAVEVSETSKPELETAATTSETAATDPWTLKHSVIVVILGVVVIVFFGIVNR